MQIRAVYPQTELRGDPNAVRLIGRAVEDLGFDHLLSYDHVLSAVPADRSPALTGPYTERDPLVMFAHLAATTERIGFATGVLVLVPAPPPDRAGGTAGRRRRPALRRQTAPGRGDRLESRRIPGPRAGLPHPRREPLTLSSQQQCRGIDIAARLLGPLLLGLIVLTIRSQVKR